MIINISITLPVLFGATHRNYPHLQSTEPYTKLFHYNFGLLGTITDMWLFYTGDFIDHSKNFTKWYLV